MGNGVHRWIPALLTTVLLAGACAGDATGHAAGSVAVDARTSAVEVTESVSIEGDVLCSFGDDECPREGDPAVGRPAPRFVSADPDGTAVDLGSGPALVVFVSHWCEFCQADLPTVVEAASTVPVVVVSTAQDPDAENWPPSSWLVEAGWTGRTAVDDIDVSLAHAYGVSALPYWVAVDADGRVRERATGSKTLDEILELAG